MSEICYLKDREHMLGAGSPEVLGRVFDVGSSLFNVPTQQGGPRVSGRGEPTTGIRYYF